MAGPEAPKGPTQRPSSPYCPAAGYQIGSKACQDWTEQLQRELQRNFTQTPPPQPRNRGFNYDKQPARPKQGKEQPIS